MDPLTNTQAVITAARENGEVKTLKNGAEIIAVPTGSKIEHLSRPAHGQLPTRLLIERVFHDGDSFARYVGRYKQAGSQLIADIDAGKVTAILDYPSDTQTVFSADDTPDPIPGREHKAVWPVAHSEAFETWDKISGEWLKQDEFLAFLEENVDDIISPEPADILTLVKDFSAVKSEKFERATRLQSGDANLTHITETNVRQDLVVPRRIRLKMPIYHGEDPIEFEAWFRYRISAGLHIQIEFHRIEPVKQAAFRAAVARLHDLGAGVDASYGVA